MAEEKVLGWDSKDWACRSHSDPWGGVKKSEESHSYSLSCLISKTVIIMSLYKVIEGLSKTV